VAVATEALRRRERFRERALSIARENLKVLDAWGEERIGFRRPDGALMALLRLPDRVDDLRFAEMLLEQYDTAVCPGRYFGIEGHVRATFSCAPSDFGKGLENISAALDTYLS